MFDTIILLSGRPSEVRCRSRCSGTIRRLTVKPVQTLADLDALDAIFWRAPG